MSGQNEKSAWLEKVRVCVLENMASTRVGPVFIAEQMSVSRSTLDRKIKAYSGMTASAYIRQCKMAYAYQQLLETDQLVKRIAHACGYTSPVRFSQDFRKVYGQSPSSVREGGMEN